MTDGKTISGLLALMNKAPKPFAAGWFSVIGLFVSMLLFSIPAARSQTNAYLYIFLPTLSAGLGGYFLGSRVLGIPNTFGYFKAFIAGLMASLISFIAFAPLYSVTYSLTRVQRHLPLVETARLCGAVLGVGIIAVGPVILPAGGMGAVLLFALRRHFERLHRDH